MHLACWVQRYRGNTMDETANAGINASESGKHWLSGKLPSIRCCIVTALGKCLGILTPRSTQWTLFLAPWCRCWTAEVVVMSFCSLFCTFGDTSRVEWLVLVLWNCHIPYTACLSNILFKKNIPNILFQGKIFFYIVRSVFNRKVARNNGLKNDFFQCLT